MTDFPPPTKDSYAQHFYGPTPSNFPSQNTPIRYRRPIRVKKSSVSNVQYRTPCNCIFGFICVVLFIVGIVVSVALVSQGISSGKSKEILFGLFPLFFTLVAIILGSCTSLYFSIDIENSFGTISITKVKLFFCFSKKEIIKVNDLQQVIVQTDPTTNYEINGVHYDSFEILFKLNNGREVKGCSGVIDKNGESRKAFNVIRSALPPNIPFGGNLAY